MAAIADNSPGCPFFLFTIRTGSDEHGQPTGEIHMKIIPGRERKPMTDDIRQMFMDAAEAYQKHAGEDVPIHVDYDYGCLLL